MNDQAIENEIQAKGKTAPRITPAHIQATIVACHYFSAADGVLGAIYSASEDGDIGDAGAPVALCLLTFCVLTLQNGFTVTGESACASPENFDAEIGRKIARQNAEGKIWALEGYLLKQQLHDQGGQMDRIARVAHEVNRAYCQALGDGSQPAWEEAPAWQRESARMGVDLHTMGDFGPEASHISWLNQKLNDGWVYGEVKDAEAKTHPCIRPFGELSTEQQAKDYLFRGVVHALRG